MDENRSMERRATVADMARSREARAARQSALLAEHGGCLVCLTMNVAGPVKTNPLIARGFALGARMVRDALEAHRLGIVYQETRLPFTGPEAYFSVRADALRVKRLACALEERDAFGRLLDIDVLSPDGSRVSRQETGLPPRRCLICNGPAAPCAASRRHPADELFAEATRILRERLDARFFDETAGFAARSLLFELSVTPKPGLVDRDNSGSHPDMDFLSFTASASALSPYFRACAQIGAACGATGEAFARLRTEGALAEGMMLRATGGVNTHKGAIFTLGILCAAAGSLYAHGLPLKPEALSQASVSMTAATLEAERKAAHAGQFTDETRTGAAEDAPPPTFGESLQTTRLAGARAEAARGFPGALAGLAALDEALSQGLSLNDAGVRALLAILVQTEDTTLLKRAGPGTAARLKARAAEILRHGAPIAEVRALDADFIQCNASMGGAADLLAAGMFLRFAREGEYHLC